MKRIFLFVLMLCMLLLSCGGLTACQEEHIHRYSAFWTFDDEYHWHDCEENCGNFIERSPHEWDEGVVTQEADEETIGILTYRCKICGKEKNERFDFDASGGPTVTVRKDQMKRAFAREAFQNVTMIFYSANSGAFAKETVYLFSDRGTYWYQVDAEGNVFDEQYDIKMPDGNYRVYTKDKKGVWRYEDLTYQRFSLKYADFAKRFSDQYSVFAEYYDDFDFNEEEQEYQLFEGDVGNNHLSYAIMRFSAKHLTYLSFLRPIGSYLDFGNEIYGNFQEFSFVNYGNTSFEIPEDALPLE